MTFSASELPANQDDARCAEERHGYPLTAGAQKDDGLGVVQPDSGEQPIQEPSRDSPDGPPRTDRGAEKPNRFGRRVDWCEFSVRGVSCDDVERVLDGYLPGGFIDGAGSFYGYASNRIGPGGGRVLSDEHRPEVHVILPGKWCGAVDEPQMRGLLLWLDASGGTTTRLDLATDDFERLITPADIRSAVLADQLVTHTKNATYHETLRGEDGTTAYVGARSSRVMLRIYDKAIESRGSVNAIRWELVLRKQAAQAIQRDLAVKPWTQTFNAQLLRFADFRERNAGPKIGRCPRLGWYDEIIGDVVKARPYMPTPVYSAEKSMEHFRRNQAPTLAALVASEGGAVDFIFEGVRDGKKRWRSKHKVIAGDVASALDQAHQN